MRKFDEGREFDWDDLRDLLRRTEEIDCERICAACAGSFRFLADLSPDERVLANNAHQREQELWGSFKPQWRLQRAELNRAPLAHATWKY